MHGEDSVTASQLRDKIKLMEDAYKQTYDELNKLNRVDLESQVAKFGPKSRPTLNTEGGENYREIIIKTPKSKIAQENFEGSHHEDPNILMHLRVADHKDVEGKSGLLIDELQSDWHQKGRDEGYGKRLVDMPQMSADELYDKHFNDLTPAQKEYLEEFMKKWDSAEYSGADKELDKLTDQYQSWTNKQTIGSGVPNAPFKEDWYQLGLKRAIKEAADTGKDRVYLTTGKTQIDRYEHELRANVDSIEYEPYKGDNGELLFEISGVKNGESVISKEELTYKELQDLVGKDMAEKMKNNAGESLAKERPMRPDWMRLSGDNLSIGGEGMKQYYDKNYINWLKKYAKEHGATVGETRLPVGGKRDFMSLSTEEVYKYRNDPEFMKYFNEASNGKDYNSLNDKEFMHAWTKALSHMNGQKVYYLELNPKLRNTAKKGQAFAGGGAVQSPNDFDYESHVNNIMNAHNASNFDYEGHVKKIMGMAEGGAAYNTQPDMSDGGISIQAPAFKIGGRIPLLTR